MDFEKLLKKEDALVKIGERLGNARRRQHITQQTFAEKAGISVSYLSEIENGHKDPSTSVFYSICYENGISADELIYGPKKESSIMDIIREKSSSLTLNDVELLIEYFTGYKTIIEKSMQLEEQS